MLSLIDMDIGFFISYELTGEAITTRLFRIFRINTIPLVKGIDFREATESDITPLNRVNWFNFLRSRRVLSPIYTLCTAGNRPRIFMRLDFGSHIDLKNKIKGLIDE